MTMKAIIAFCGLILAAIVGYNTVNVTYVVQGEKVFAYSVSSGKKVNPIENPLLPTGFNSSFGFNQRFFSVLGTIMDYEFTANVNSGSSRYNEALTWNSEEGIVMSADYKIYGRVTDPWEFFLHFGEPEHDYRIAKGKDPRVYEALRQTGRVMDQRLNEYACTNRTELLRTHPDVLKSVLLKNAQEYMRKFGFEVTDLIFIGNFQYPDGDTITQARKEIVELDSEIRNATQFATNQANQVQIAINSARRARDVRIEGAKRAASALLAETAGISNALKMSVEQIGVEGTMQLRQAQMSSELARAGILQTVILDQHSVLGQSFYSK